jgi:hypothetical protein
MKTHNPIGISRQDVRKLHRLGERPLYEFIRELERGAEVRATLETYAELPADLIKAYHGDRFECLLEFHGGRR